ncbi:agmatine deiminase family protein [Geothermobacter hydrogeniphilus]|uniref:Agmatine deiminase n=1 Tax=Geothermobacter hydrogeniphilus TaxID=1969733 RepID=A0A1X0XW24_9BACT|nr:agmatine deiminase family protein [Geothermobacter hydrogeniphilus]ORJ57085.1 agmatine deiminase [Geothermobacter hydrogeniphilus]
MSIRLPAEWEPQDGILIAWPHAATDWAETLDEVLPVYLQLAEAVSDREKLLIVTPDPDSVRRQLDNAGITRNTIRLARAATNDTWCRDFGPLTIYRGEQPQLLDFGFNAWGLKFAADLDNQVSRRLHHQGCFGAVGLVTDGLILEGGSIESDGRGTLLTTSRCLLSANRNPQLSREQLQARLCSRFGATRILWLEHGLLAGDDTDAHIDTLARFAPEDVILHVACDDQRDEHYAELQAMAAELAALRTAAGRPYRLLPLPWPRPICRNGRRLPATYANYLVINGAVLVPTYNDPADQAAQDIIGAAHPGRDVIGIEARPLIAQGGSLHCLTMHLPKGVLP